MRSKPQGLAWGLGPVTALSILGAGAVQVEDGGYLERVKPLLAKHCVACHSAEKPRGGLRLDTARAIHQGGSLGPAIVPGKPEESELVLALSGEGSTERMPLKRPPLSDAEVAILRQWVAAGGPVPEREEPTVVSATHWAFVPPVRPAVPVPTDPAWLRNPIDAFILAPLERDGLRPSPEADRATLIRRVTLDLTGLPPTVAEVEAFTADAAPDAYEKLVDRLLAAPGYGERWGRLWLDAARYADSNGYSIDAPRSIWPYRDWVVAALNADQPFDAFTIDQIAGDLRPDATLDQRVATGFHRNTMINQEGGIDPEQFRVESVIDRVNTTGSVWLGLTIGCAQCHDHKYDPITQREFYGLFAFLNDCDEPSLPVASPEDVARQAALRAEVAAYLQAIERDPALLDAQKAWEAGLDVAGRQKQSQEVREAFGVPFENRTADQNRPIFAAFIDQSDADAVRPHRQHVAAVRKREPAIVSTMVVSPRREPRTTRFLVAGDFTRPGDPVAAGVPAVLPPISPGDDGRLDRMDLARWLVEPNHPLTARVVVNRLWQAAFGRGLVETDSDLGTQGAPPTHPELVDWLATELVAQGWSVKAVLRTIVTSATYRQSSRFRDDLARIDPDNRRWARQQRLRLDAELVRDAALQASGLLVPALGGPPVFPPQPEGVMSLGQIRREWKTSSGPDRYRRGLYTHVWRATPHPLLTVFDAPDSTRACTRRLRSNTPLQALVLLNDEAFVECARALAARILEPRDLSDAERLERAFAPCLGRRPEARERESLLAHLGRERAAAREAGAGDPEATAWTSLARVLLNLDEFITRE